MAIRFDGVDFGGGVVDELKGIVGAMHHLLIGFRNKMNKFCRKKKAEIGAKRRRGMSLVRGSYYCITLHFIVVW